MTFLKRSDMHPYQVRMVETLKNTPKAAQWVDMGLGKTIITLTTLADLFGDFSIQKALIIAPLKVAAQVWPKEIESWAHTKWMSYTLLFGSPSSRTYKLTTDSLIHIINRENVVWLFNKLRELKQFPYDMLVVDESSSFKNRSAKRTSALLKMSFFPERIIELTATPASNTMADLWSQIAVLDHGERLGKSYSAYLAKYFTPKFLGRGYDLQNGALERINNKLNDICFRLDAKDYLALPPKLEHVITREFDDRQLAEYQRLEDKFLLDIEKMEESVVFNTGAVINKLLQFCNGAVYHDDTYTEVHDLKLDMLEELIEQCGDEPLLIGYQFRVDLERIKKKFPNAVALDRKGSQIPAWNAGDIQLLLAHPSSAGHGINLQEGGRNLCWFGLPWSLELFDQFIGRVYRQGQTKPVNIYYLLIEGSADMEVRAALKSKDKSQRALLDGIKNSIERKRLEYVA